MRYMFILCLLCITLGSLLSCSILSLSHSFILSLSDGNSISYLEAGPSWEPDPKTPLYLFFFDVSFDYIWEYIKQNKIKGWLYKKTGQ